MNRLSAWFFAPAPPARLALVRILVAGYTLWYLRSRRRMLVRLADAGPREYRPVGVVKVLDRPPPRPMVEAAVAALLAANAAVLVGWHHRVTGPLWSGLLWTVLSYRNSWSMIYHNDNLLVLHALALGLSPSADALSLDAARRPAPAVADGQYGWPLRLMDALTVTTYWLSAVAKLRGELGWRWADGEALRSQVLVDGLRKELLGGSASPVARRLHDHIGVWRAAAAGSLAIELLAPAVLPSRRLSRLWAASALGMHWGIRATMGIRFRYQQSATPSRPWPTWTACPRS